VRDAVALVLSRLGVAGIRELQNAAHSERSYTRRTVVRVLNRIGEGTAPLFASLLDDLDASVRLSAAEALAKLGDTRGVLELASASQDDRSDYVRSVGTAALVSLGQASINELARALDNESSSARLSAAVALAQFGNAAGVHLLNDAKRGTDAHMRCLAMDALECLGEDAKPRAQQPPLTSRETRVRKQEAPPRRASSADSSRRTAPRSGPSSPFSSRRATVPASPGDARRSLGANRRPTSRRATVPAPPSDVRRSPSAAARKPSSRK